MTDRKPDPDSYSEAETAKRAAATLKVMLATPHKPHKPSGRHAVGGKKGAKIVE